MKRLTRIAEVRSWREGLGDASVGLVPTMGALHEGHLSLVRRSVRDDDVTVATIFVNPAQFDDAADLKRYPCDVAGDAALLADAGCDALYTPDAAEIYPVGYQTWVEMGEVAAPLEGKARPGHLRGVATVVLKLFNQVRPDRAYFGEKDFQQVVVVETLVRDLDLPVSVVPCPTVREHDGLAMSSRNRRLGSRERQAATALYEALRAAPTTSMPARATPSASGGRSGSVSSGSH